MLHCARVGLHVGLLVLAFVGSACGGRGGSAARLPDGNKIAIMVYADRGASAQDADYKGNQVNQLADWMESDLIAMLQKTGYDASVVTTKDAPTGPGRYLLRTQIINYNGGNRAVRAYVGWGAGAARLEQHFELIGPNASVYVQGNPNVATSRSNWKHVARKVNEQTVDTINQRLRQGL